MPLSDDMLKIIVCPKCKGDLNYEREKERLICDSCRLVFRVEEDIPVLLIDEAQSL